ncbi:hypothetical protein [Roseixanthobacter liquoris]|uniref:hypothetical protein n=1 Tax=Roseixanthobacter liquoris TaxID=3119921 RepID=UPI00372BA5D3
MTGAREEDRREAAEYVLGTLDAAERSAARARIASDSAFAALVTLWERRLGPLHELAVGVAPPEGLLQELMAELPEPAAPAVAEAAPEHGPGAAPSALPTSNEAPSPEPPSEEAPSEAQPSPAQPSPATEAPVAEEALPVPPVVAEAEIRELEKDPTLAAAPSVPAPAPVPPARTPSEPAPSEPTPAPPPAARNPWRVASGLMAIIVLALGGLLLRDWGRPEKEGAHPAPAAQISPAPTQHEAVLTPRSSPRVTITLDPATRRLDVSGLSGPPPEGQTYRLWLVSPDGTRHLLCAFRDPTALAPDLTAWTGQPSAVVEITLEAVDVAPGQGASEVILSGPLKRL